MTKSAIPAIANLSKNILQRADSIKKKIQIEVDDEDLDMIEELMGPDEKK